MRQTRSIVVRVAPDGSDMYGVFRLTASRLFANIENICGEFRTDLDFKLTNCAKVNDLFFYGHEKDFEGNFKTVREAEINARALFPKHLVSIYGKKTDANIRNGTGYARIPLAEIGLDKERLGLVSEVLDYYSRLLVNLSHRLDKVYVPSEENIGSYRSTIGQLKRFPQNLADLAFKQSHYFGLNQQNNLSYSRQPQLTAGQISEIPSRRDVLTPRAVRKN